MHQIVCRLGFAPDPTLELTALPKPLAGLGAGAPREKGRREGRGKEGGIMGRGYGRGAPGMP